MQYTFIFSIIFSFCQNIFLFDSLTWVMFLLVVNQLVCSLSMPSTIPQMKKRCFFFWEARGELKEDINFFMIWLLLFCGTQYSIWLLCRLLYWQLCSYCRFWNFPNGRSNGMYNSSSSLELF